jgi:hypothetical protein
VQVGDKIKRIKTKVQVLINQLEILHTSISLEMIIMENKTKWEFNDALIDQFGDDNTAKQNKQDH